MKLRKLLIASIVLLVSACSTTYKPTSDSDISYNFETIKSFNVVGDDQLRNPLVSDINRQRIDTAVSTALVNQGKVQTDNIEADVLISYFIVTKDKVKINSTYSGSNGYYHRGYAGVSQVSTRHYVEGTLVIDIVDNESQQTVWRSTLTKSLKDYDSSAERDEAINNAVESMFNTLPVKETSLDNNS